MEAVKKYDMKEIKIRLNKLRNKFGSYEVDREIDFQSKYTNNWCDNLNLAYRALKNRHTKIYRNRFGIVRHIIYEIKQRRKLCTLSDKLVNNSYGFFYTVTTSNNYVW